MIIRVHLTAADTFIVDSRVVALAPGSYTPLPAESDPNYQAAYDALEAQLLAVIAEADNSPPPTLAELKREKTLAAQREQERRMGLGFRVAIGGNEIIVSSDAGQIEDIKLQVDEINAGIAYPAAGVRLLARDGTEYTATQAQFIAVFRAWRARVRALRDRYGELVQTILGASDPAELAAIDPQRGSIDGVGGWPPV